MPTVAIPRVRPAPLDLDTIASLARRFRVAGEHVEAEDAVVISSDAGVVVHGRAGNRMGGLTTAVDLTRGVASPGREPLPAPTADSLSTELLEAHGLGATRTRSELEITWRLASQITDAVVFDGEQRRRQPAVTEVRARVLVDGVPVSGPRAGAALTFLDGEAPLRMTVTTWTALEVHEESELLDRDEVVAELLVPARDRRRRAPGLEILSMDLAYWAGPYAGGADVLQPCWFVLVRVTGLDGEANPPRQLLRLPATR